MHFARTKVMTSILTTTAGQYTRFAETNFPKVYLRRIGLSVFVEFMVTAITPATTFTKISGWMDGGGGG